MLPRWVDQSLLGLKQAVGEKRMARLRRTAAYQWWRLGRERTFEERVERFLKNAPAGAPPYTEAALAASLRARAAIRRLPKNGERLGVVAFGVDDWEDKGLWQAALRWGDGSRFDQRAHIRKSDGVVARRAQWTLQLLSHLDEREANGRPVHVVFLYAGAADLEPALFESLHARGIWTVLMGLDDKQQWPEPLGGETEGRQLSIAQKADVYWTTWRTGADLLAAQGGSPWYAPPGADPTFFAPKEVEKTIPVVWVGRLYGPRLELIRYLREQGIDVRTFGFGTEGGPVSFDTLVTLFSQARVVLGMGGVGPTDHVKHLKGRDFEAPMAGACYLTSFNPELPDAYSIGDEVLCYASKQEALDTLRWLLARPEHAARIGRAARVRALAHHTWDARFARLGVLISGGGGVA
ncbi:MAG: glycosyltransferase [Myxococcaceae bacterium]